MRKGRKSDSSDRPTLANGGLSYFAVVEPTGAVRSFLVGQNSYVELGRPMTPHKFRQPNAKVAMKKAKPAK